MATEDERTVNINLVCEVGKYRCLYDITQDDYCERQLRENTWAEIGDHLGMTGTSAKNRWANLRTVYVRKRKKSPKSLSGDRKPYYLDKYMQFLIPTLKMKAKSMYSNLPRPVPKTQQLQKKASPSVEAPVEQQEASMDDGEDDDDDDDNDETTSFEAGMNPGEEIFEPYPNQPYKKFCKYVNSKDDDDKALMEYVAARKCKVEIGGDTENPRRMFLLSLLPEVNELPEYQFRTFKRRVLALLDEMEQSRSETPTTSTASTPFPH